MAGEIKSRAQSVNDKKWYYFPLKSLIAEHGGYDENNFVNWCEYTGLKDKNGKEYYDCDIMQWIQPDYTSTRLEKVVRHDGGWWIADLKTGEVMIPLRAKEAILRTIIGNVYENPELIGRVSQERYLARRCTYQEAKLLTETQAEISFKAGADAEHAKLSKVTDKKLAEIVITVLKEVASVASTNTMLHHHFGSNKYVKDLKGFDDYARDILSRISTVLKAREGEVVKKAYQEGAKSRQDEIDGLNRDFNIVTKGGQLNE